MQVGLPMELSQVHSVVTKVSQSYERLECVLKPEMDCETRDDRKWIKNRDDREPEVDHNTEPGEPLWLSGKVME
jgi:hypothetical protein